MPKKQPIYRKAIRDLDGSDVMRVQRGQPVACTFGNEDVGVFVRFPPSAITDADKASFIEELARLTCL